MQIDDRLATVLRMRAGSDAVLRTQFRQLLDLLGTSRDIADHALKGEAYARLGELMGEIAQEDQSRILREPGLRLRDPELVAFLAAGEAKPSAAAMATAQLSEEQWLALIPRLPVTARGFLRHRRVLPERVKRQLEELGVGDLVLPDLDPGRDAPAIPAPSPAAGKSGAGGTAEGIGALLRRIEAFREERRAQSSAPQSPPAQDPQDEPLTGFEFATDFDGRVTWASGPVAAQIVGLGLAAPRPGPLIERSEHANAQLAARQPLKAVPITLDAAPAISGAWFCDAAPLFDPQSGAFTGYRGCLRRPAAAAEEDREVGGEGDVMREVLHELRTPVNAIQGFAEIIQQQLFGPAPHEYRAHAAAIAVDAAKLLAGFDEVDRLVKLEGGAMKLEAGESDFRAVIDETAQRLQGVLRPRNAGFTLKVNGEDFAIGLDRSEALALAWRLLATAAGALGPGETIKLSLKSDGERIRLRMKVPTALRDPRRSETDDRSRRRAVSAGMFGPQFAFRLAQAEARVAGGKIECAEDRVTLRLPALTASARTHSAAEGRADG